MTQGASAQPRVVGEGLLFSRYCPCDMGFGWRATLLTVPLSQVSVFIMNVHSSRGVLTEMEHGESMPTWMYRMAAGREEQQGSMSRNSPVGKGESGLGSGL